MALAGVWRLQGGRPGPWGIVALSHRAFREVACRGWGRGGPAGCLPSPTAPPSSPDAHLLSPSWLLGTGCINIIPFWPACVLTLSQKQFEARSDKPHTFSAQGGPKGPSDEEGDTS